MLDRHTYRDIIKILMAYPSRDRCFLLFTYRKMGCLPADFTQAEHAAIESFNQLADDLITSGLIVQTADRETVEVSTGTSIIQVRRLWLSYEPDQVKIIQAEIEKMLYES